MVPLKLIFWSISGKESVAYQQKHAFRNRFSQALLSLVGNFDPRYNRIMLLRKKTSNLDKVCFNDEQLFHPVLSTACRICQNGS